MSRLFQAGSSNICQASGAHERLIRRQVLCSLEEYVLYHCNDRRSNSQILPVQVSLPDLPLRALLHVQLSHNASSSAQGIMASL